MASSTSEKSRCGVLSGLCWLLGAGLKVSTLVVLLALLATVHQLRSAAEENAFKVERAERELAAATSQQEDAIRAYKEVSTQSNQLQTDLANSRREIQELQVQLSKKLDVQKDLDRKAQEAKSAKAEVLVLTQKVQELEADARRKELEQQKDQDASSLTKALESEKQQLQEKVSALEASLLQEKNSREAASGQQKSLTETLQKNAAKLAQAEKLNEQHTAKAKAQDKKIEELQEKLKKLEEAKKAGEADAWQLAALRDGALRDLEAARAETAQAKKDSESKALELQKALAENGHLKETITETNVDIAELMASKKELLQQLREQSAAAEAHIAEKKNLESEKNKLEHAGSLMSAEISSRDKQIQELSAQADVFRKKWTECDNAAKEKLSQLKAALGECEASRDSAVPAQQQQPVTDACDCSSLVARETAGLQQQCEKERLIYKTEKKEFESIMHDLFHQLDVKDDSIQKLEEKSANTQKKLLDVEKTLTEKVAVLQADLRACLAGDADSCAGTEGEESCRDRADCSKLKVQIMDLETSLKSSEEQRRKLEATVQKTREDWTKANEHADEMRLKANEAEKLARGRERMIEDMREKVMQSAEITHGDIVKELSALAKEHDKLLQKYNEEVKPLQEKLEKARKGWLQNDKELVELKKELKREKLRVSLCEKKGDDKE